MKVVKHRPNQTDKVRVYDLKVGDFLYTIENENSITKWLIYGVNEHPKHTLNINYPKGSKPIPTKKFYVWEEEYGRDAIVNCRDFDYWALESFGSLRFLSKKEYAGEILEWVIA